jgi:hypothetical protein
MPIEWCKLIHVHPHWSFLLHYDGRKLTLYV